MRWSFQYIGLLITTLLLCLTVSGNSVSYPINNIISSPQKLAQAANSTREQKIIDAVYLNQEGYDLYQRAEAESALDKYNQALVIFRQVGARGGEGNSLNYIGQVYLSLGKYDRALDYFQQALVIFKTLGKLPDFDRASEGYTLQYLGEVYDRKRDYEGALASYQQALTIFQELIKIKKGDRDSFLSSEEYTLNPMGAIYFKLGNYKQSLNLYKQLSAINQEQDDHIGEVQNLNNLGVTYANLSEYGQALAAYQEALTKIKLISDCAHQNPNNSLCYGGEEAAIRNNLAALYFSLGQYEQALDFAQQASVIFQKNLGRDYQGLKPQDFQLLHDILGKSSLSPAFVRQSLAIRAGVGNVFSAESMVREGEAVNLNNLGQIYSNQGNDKQALTLYQQALSIYQEINNSLGVAITLNNIAQINTNLGQYDVAVNFNQQALAIYQKEEDKAGIGVTLTNIGQIYQKQGKFTQSLDSLNQALVIQKTIEDRGSIAITLRIIGLDMLQTNKINEAIVSLTESIKVIESLHPGLNDANKISLFESHNLSYKLLQKALITQKQPNQALEVSERGRSRAFVELLSQRLANEETPNSSSQQGTIKPPTIAEIQKIASVEHATLVEYSLISDRELYIWVIKPTGEITLRQVQLNAFKNIVNKEEISGLDIKKLVIDARNSFFSPGTSQTKPQLQQLHQIFIQPIADLLPNNPQDLVILIPQHSLFLLPFYALIDPDGKYLIEKHTILTAPSIQVLDLTHQQKQKNQRINPQNTLIVGNPIMPSLPPKLGDLPVQLDALPGAELEAEVVAQVLKTQAIIGSQATKQAIVQQMLNSKIIHLATHGLLDDIGKKGLPGAIALAPFNNDDGLLTAYEILNLKFNADLVVLSACNTGRGRITGDGVVGLSRSFISAGTSSIIVSLWSIPDDTTAVLMPEFYRQLQQNSNKAEALRQAMLITLKKYPNPKDWAAFTLIGEAQ
ncbi:CHAT domain-containing protein [Microcoleus sp. Pol11C3]|uniref:CHAT domain-containing tetratricopeptide repeat protein n=1 Tax=Microcoleus sp. Pol11C3 TaxID=3055390 RepID=UPI002FD49FF0